MDPSDITDRTSLEAWLKDQPQETAVAIAHRAAMRASPYFRPFGHSVNLRFLRAILVCGVSAITPGSQHKQIASRAYVTNRAASEGVMAAAAYAAAAAAATTSKAAGHAAAYATDAAVAEVSADTNESIGWKMVAADAARNTTIPTLLATPLGTRLSEFDRSEINNQNVSDWDFWRRWHLAALDGCSLIAGDWDAHWSLLERIALIDPDDSQGLWSDPTALAAEIREIEKAHAQIDAAIEATPNAEHIVFDPVTGLLTAIPANSLSEDLRAYILRDVEKAARRFRRDCGAPGANLGRLLLDCADTELADLLDDLADMAGGDLALHDDLERCANALRRRFADQSVETDPLAQNLMFVLDRCLTDIVATSPEVLEVVERRGAETYRRLSLEHRDELTAWIIGMAGDSDERLARELHEDLRIGEDTAADEEERRRSRYRNVSRLPRGARAINYSRFRDGVRVVDPPQREKRDGLWWATLLGPSGAVILSGLLGL